MQVLANLREVVKLLIKPVLNLIFSITANGLRLIPLLLGRFILFEIFFANQIIVREKHRSVCVFDVV